MKFPARQVKPKTKKSTPDVVVREAKLMRDRNWWMLSTLLLIIALIVAIVLVGAANKRFAENVQISWVKMYRDGTWDVDIYDRDDRALEREEAVIDSLLRQWVEKRYSKIPYTITYDYEFARQLMSQQMQTGFMSKEGFNAPRKVSEAVKCSNCSEVHVKVRTLNHFNEAVTAFNGEEGVLYQTNVFVEEKEVSPIGDIIESNKHIVSLQWRLKSKAEIMAGGKEALWVNPIGLEIIKAEYLVDPSF